MESRKQQHARTYSVLTHTFNPWVGSKVKTFFSESSHVAYQKGMEHRAPCRHIYLHTPSTHGVGSKVKIFLFFYEAALLHIKLKGIEHRTLCKHTFCPYTHPQHVGRLKGKTTLNVVMFHIKLKKIKFRLT